MKKKLMRFRGDLQHTYDKNFKQVLTKLKFELYAIYVNAGINAIQLITLLYVINGYLRIKINTSTAS
ncbi:hypothetical protein WJR50_06800 [Catalinimonas sp. 4WD22]|uniref:hypothetical protein n=1 Tax=Catalinimonas locisalis TaxID=3133978 RepID=UPI0031017584